MRAIFSCVALLAAAAAAVGGDDFALKDGDTVAFLGDSITAARAYGKFVENYTLLRYPDRKVRFFNVGRGGDTAAGGLARLKEDVFDRGATVLTVAYGINDIGWGTKADDEHRNLYLNSLREICRQCKEKNVRVFICSAAATASDPDKSENDYLKKMCDEGMQIGRDHGAGAIDVQGEMRKIQRRIKEANEREKPEKDKEHTLHARDGIHLNDLGQVAFAYALLKGLGAPADVSSATLDATTLESVASGCAITETTRGADSIEFIRLDEGLPLNGETFFSLHFRFVPIPDNLNRYLLMVTSLEPARYSVTADDRLVGTFSAAELADGVNIASATADPWQPGGPWSAQANILHSLTESRDKLDMARMLSVAHLNGRDLPTELAGEAIKANARIEEMQRLVARPRSYRFVIRKSPDSGAKPAGG
ncbi:GDSL-like Lipase/Acylhydrolase [Caulifigura coniformis]|uniref:GDSL-like Lipase/Acylhydrolase n=1 Tax=Caulifigura coniformis TaxID=2527983 RepID=A0A517S8A6_9PLAN|nr:SGNH/GDSL hydrolase family protein [Caulifigura coniformis]QDT52358.1 GDSL-like Lipase/Acylhydrolase [Caulifigura coniformis]